MTVVLVLVVVVVVLFVAGVGYEVALSTGRLDRFHHGVRATALVTDAEGGAVVHHLRKRPCFRSHWTGRDPYSSCAWHGTPFVGDVLSVSVGVEKSSLVSGTSSVEQTFGNDRAEVTKATPEPGIGDEAFCGPSRHGDQYDCDFRLDNALVQVELHGDDALKPSRSAEVVALMRTMATRLAATSH